jgi:hypothetical protein
MRESAISASPKTTYLQDYQVVADTTEVVCALWNSNVTLDLPIRVR